jgi:hypothetical protein
MVYVGKWIDGAVGCLREERSKRHGCFYFFFVLTALARLDGWPFFKRRKGIF